MTLVCTGGSQAGSLFYHVHESVLWHKSKATSSSNPGAFFLSRQVRTPRSGRRAKQGFEGQMESDLNAGSESGMPYAYHVNKNKHRTKHLKSVVKFNTMIRMLLRNPKSS